MTERRDYVGLDWVAGEIAESLQAAKTALQSYMDDPNDSTRLHFCLAHIHQVQGSLQMVEFFGIALLADEMERLVNAVLDRKIPDSLLSDALQALKRSLDEMPRYLEKVQQAHREFPAELILALNELRAVCGEPLMATRGIFSPDLANGTRPSEKPLQLGEAEFLDVAKKLRQMYQVALLSYYRGHEQRKNLNYMAKVCARAAKICRGYPVQDMWVVCIALLEGLLNNSIYSGFAVRSLLRRIDREIRLFVEAGPAVLGRPLPEALLRDMLFYVANSKATSNYIRDVKKRYNTSASLPALDSGDSHEALAGVRAALVTELNQIAGRLEVGDFTADTRLQLGQLVQTSAVLGLTQEYQKLNALLQRIPDDVGADAALATELRQVADALGESPSQAGAVGLFNDSEEAQQQLDRAHLAVVRESRNGLELAKEAVVNFVANQWQADYLKELPELLGSISGSLLLAELRRAARVLEACRAFVSEQLLEDPHTPDWQTLDALADALTSVDYYLERCASDFSHTDSDVLALAERCVGQLGYPVEEGGAAVEVDRPLVQGGGKDRAASEPESQRKFASESESASDEKAEMAAASEPEPEAVAESAPAAEGLAEEEQPAVDDELVEIFVEEAEEVLDTLREFRPALDDNPEDEDALAELRRGFHTLKGSGRMVQATQIGELAWTLENLLNRVVEGRFSLDATRLNLIDQVMALLPSMIDAFKVGKTIDADQVKRLAGQAEALAAEQSPDLSAFAEAEPEPASDPNPDSDDTLAEIFVSEARIHLQMLENFLAYAEAPIEVPDAVQRSLHTLKGAANMAEMQSIARLISPLESYIKEMRALRHVADVDALMLLRDASGAAAAAIDRIELGEPEQVSNLDVLLQRISSLHQRLLLNAQDDESKDNEQQLAPGELDGFLVATGETLAAVEHTLANYADAASLHRLAETCGQIARRAESISSLDAIAELADALAEVMKAARGPVPEEAIQLCQAGTEALDGMLNQLAAEQKPQEDAELLERLRAFDYDTTLAADAEQLGASDDDEHDDIPLVEDAIVIEEPPAETGEAESQQHPAAENLAADDADGEQQAELEEITLAAPAFEEDDVDPEVAAIFLEEADELLEGVDEAINAWSESDGSQSDLNNLLRHLHTIKGGARMAGLSSLGTYTHEFESFVEAAIDSGESHSDHFLPRLHAFQDNLVAGLAAVHRGEAFKAAVPGKSEPPALKQAVQPSPASPEEALKASQLENEVVSIFLEEADDLIEAIDDAIQYWTGDRSNAEHLELLQRHLHNFKGGARRAGLVGLGDISHEFETYIAQSTERDDGFLAQMLSYQDRMGEGLEAVRKGNRNWVSEPLLPSLPVDSEEPPTLVPENDEQTPFKSSSDRAAPATMEAQAPQEMIKVPAQLMENLVNLAGETSISRGRAEEQVVELAGSLDEMAMTVERLQEQVRRLDIETEAQILFRQEQVESEGQDGFDPLEFDRYSQLQQLSRSLMESSSDLLDIRNTLGERTRDMETLLLQQGRINTELQEGLMRSRMVHFTRMIPRLRRIVRQVSLEVGKRVEFKVYNAEGELDRQVLERIIPPLEHMLRNAVDHGIETADQRRAAGKSPVGNISMRFGREGGDVLIVLNDDGGGINFEAVRAKAVQQGLIGENDPVTEEQLSGFLFEAGFSTVSEVTQISGRGVGMDVVYSEIKQLGGSIQVESTRGQGTRFTIRLPFTVSVNRALMVSVGGDIFAIPINTVEGVVRVSPYELEVYYQKDAPPFEYAKQDYMLRYLGGLLRTQITPHLEGQSEPRPVLLARGTDRPIAVQVDSILGSREIVVKALGPQFSHVHGLSGATVLGDGSVVVIVDIPALVRAEVQRGRDAMLDHKPQQMEQRNPLVMVVDDSVTVRKVTSRLLERQGFEVLLAKDGVDAVTQLQTAEDLPDVILLDIEMPRMDGFEVASRVRHTSRLQDIPIVMITSRTGDKHRERAHQLGVNRYLGKPFQEITLLQTIGEVLGETAAS